MPQPDLARSPFEVGDMDFVDSGLLGQVDLPPAALLAKLADAFSELDADIRGHSSSIDLADALYLVDTLSGDVFPVGAAPVRSCVQQRLMNSWQSNRGRSNSAPSCIRIWRITKEVATPK